MVEYVHSHATIEKNDIVNMSRDCGQYIDVLDELFDIIDCYYVDYSMFDYSDEFGNAQVSESLENRCDELHVHTNDTNIIHHINWHWRCVKYALYELWNDGAQIFNDDVGFEIIVMSVTDDDGIYLIDFDSGFESGGNDEYMFCLRDVITIHPKLESFKKYLSHTVIVVDEY